MKPKQNPLTFLCVGSAVQDVFLSNSPEFVPACDNPEDCFFEIPLGAKINVNNIAFATGGGATNAATTFARAGEHAIFMGQIANDPAGVEITKVLDEEGINTAGLATSYKHHTGYSVFLLAPSGERTILTYRGASTHFLFTNFDLTRIEQDFDWMYVTTLNGHFEILDKLFHDAKKRGAKIAFNPGKNELADQKKLKPLLSDVDILLANREELSKCFTGENLEELVRQAHNYCPVVVGTDGAAGAMAIDKTSFAVAGLYNAESRVIDRTGAGDSFGSAFVLGYARGLGLKKALIYGGANSDAVVQQIGAKTGILTSYTNLHSMKIDIRPTNY
ncbi:MAG: carbohydrate kinase family protein [Candidatus Nomurabacteria bacterium]|nr:carbohydrate kinase family protein [Candidatus Nomurabacteria bacterium]